MITNNNFHFNLLKRFWSNPIGLDTLLEEFEDKFNKKRSHQLVLA